MYRWLGTKENQGVHWRNGSHNQNEEDWTALFEFCDRYFYKKQSGLDFKENPYPKTYDYDGLINFQAPN